MRVWFCFLLLTFLRAAAHEEPTSYIEMEPSPDGLTVSLTASATDLAHYLPSADAAMLLKPDTLENQRPALNALVQQRLRLAGLTLEPVKAGAIPEKADVRLEFRAAWKSEPASQEMECELFPYDPRHRTFVTVRRNGAVESTQIFHQNETRAVLPLGKPQGTGEAMRQFLAEGIHHIFIGPDHILFVVGLLLLGGGVGKLLKIVTAFTVAHSITLGLATFQILTPSASLVEPVIALSIVLVGIHAILPGKGTGKRRDPRLIFAFLFGLIHGFGFAFALGELNLPRAALGWSLFAFNAGVEAGQACIVMLAAPILGMLRYYSPRLSERVVMACAVGVIMAGTFWFVERMAV